MDKVEKVVYRSVMTALVALFLVSCFAGCGHESSTATPSIPTVLREATLDNPARFDFTKVSTTGNRSYIPLTMNGTPYEHRQLILDVLYAFEGPETNRHIVSWAFDFHQNTSSSNDYIYGIWVDHRPLR